MKISRDKLSEILNTEEVQKHIHDQLVCGNAIELKIEKNKFVVLYIPRKAVLKVDID